MLVALLESVSIVLLAIRAFQFRHFEQSLMTTLYCDGLYSYFCILAFTIGNVVVILGKPLRMSLLLIVVQRVMHSVLCNRILLHVREVYELQRTIPILPFGRVNSACEFSLGT
ncbi:hypothetical protein BD410DRAFT_630272 [Rickenella mellea]|uniref:Uncharacterized protein n=1 Tax=Rickenella mellea TaxID=50990 RepID=A0A4Y7QCW8_9AGAM|nr:hypothetical protein BD410DRAFT_630272 [Rickenella mellea]